MLQSQSTSAASSVRVTVCCQALQSHEEMVTCEPVSVVDYCACSCTAALGFWHCLPTGEPRLQPSNTIETHVVLWLESHRTRGNVDLVLWHVAVVHLLGLHLLLLLVLLPLLLLLLHV